jgi:RES domain-containing protein
MRFWRLARRRFSALDGYGSHLYGGRWNRAGLAVVYCAEHLSLAVLEVLVHLELDPEDFPDDYVKIAIEVPRSIKLDRIESLPSDLEDAKELGSEWIRSGETLGLLVPSVLVHEERNLLLNPEHRDFSRLAILDPQPFRFDPRFSPP